MEQPGAGLPGGGPDGGEAIRLHERALVGRVRALGAEHLDTLASRNNLAIACQQVGRTAEAIRLHERALACRVRALGPGHPDTLASRNNLATACQQMGWADGAITSFRRALANTRERMLGPATPTRWPRGTASRPPYLRWAGPTRRSPCSSRSWRAGCGCWAPAIPTRWPRGTTSATPT